MPAINKFKKITYKLKGLDIAAASEGQNFNAKKIKTLIKQSLSLWTAYALIRFEESSAIETDISIEFINETGQTAALGVTIFRKSIEMNTTNRFFIDKFNEKENPPYTFLGPFDLIFALTHEIGHALGLDHPPIDAQTHQELFPGSMMSSSIGEKAVRRQLSQYDIDKIAAKYHAPLLGDNVTTNLEYNSSVKANFEGLHFIKGTWGIQLDGPVGNSISLFVFMPTTKNKYINSITLKYNTYTSNTMVHSVEVFDGTTPIQEYYLSSAISKGSSTAFKEWTFTLGILDKKKVITGYLVKINIEFRNVEATHDVGVFQLMSLKASSLLELAAEIPNIVLLNP